MGALNCSEDKSDFDERCDKFERITPVATTIREDVPFPVFPVEITEELLLKASLQLFVCLFNSTRRRWKKKAEVRTYVILAGVSYNWWHSLKGWEQSTTKNWFRHQFKKRLERVMQLDEWTTRHSARIHTNSRVQGVAEIDGHLFVSCYKSSSIIVFSCNNRKQRQQSLDLNDDDSNNNNNNNNNNGSVFGAGVTVKQVGVLPVVGLYEPSDIAACSDSGRLFVAEAASCRVWCVHVNQLERRDVSIDVATPSSVSVTDRRLLVSSMVARKFCRLRLYNEKLDAEEAVCLPAYMELQHAVESGRGTFLVAHFERGGLQRHQISEVDRQGHVLKTYGTPKNDSSQVTSATDTSFLNIPCYLSSDRRGQRIFVADWLNDRVLVLDSKLTFRRLLIDSEVDRIRRPHRLCFVPSRRLLAVATSSAPFGVDIFVLAPSAMSTKRQRIYSV